MKTAIFWFMVGAFFTALVRLVVSEIITIKETWNPKNNKWHAYLGFISYLGCVTMEQIKEGFFEKRRLAKIEEIEKDKVGV